MKKALAQLPAGRPHSDCASSLRRADVVWEPRVGPECVTFYVEADAHVLRYVRHHDPMPKNS